MAFYTVTYIHKISSTCKCGRSRSDHEGTGATSGKGGCRITGCTKFEYESQVADLPSALVEYGTRTEVAAMLREAKPRLLCRGDRLGGVTRHDGKLVCFPQASIWHSIIIVPVPVTDPK